METRAASDKPLEAWGSGEAYERYVGRWSRGIAREFLAGLSVATGADWADVGCGTGALAESILVLCDPASVRAIDKSAAYVETAQKQVGQRRATFEVGDAAALPWADASFDACVSALVLNFVPQPAAMAAEMARVTRPGGTVAAYVWDYAGGMQMMRHFWDAAIALNPGDVRLDQAERFPVCRPQPLEALWRKAGLVDVSVRAIDMPMTFRDFDDYWTPFLGRQGAAPTYLASLDDDAQGRLREALRQKLVPQPDGSIVMQARAWSVQGLVPTD
jgi:SAM-dependent methyltransferase